MVLLAHIRDQHRLSLGSYGRPRVTGELNDLGVRVGQLRSRKCKHTTDSDHAFNIDPNCLN
jgi:putative transposase